MHAGQALVHIRDVRDIGKIKLRIHSLGVHIQSKGDNVHVACSFSVAEQSTFDTVRTG